MFNIAQLSAFVKQKVSVTIRVNFMKMVRGLALIFTDYSGRYL